MFNLLTHQPILQYNRWLQGTTCWCTSALVALMGACCIESRSLKVEDVTVIVTVGKPAVIPSPSPCHSFPSPPGLSPQTSIIPREWGQKNEHLPFPHGHGDIMIGITAVVGIEIGLLLLPR